MSRQKKNKEREFQRMSDGKLYNPVGASLTAKRVRARWLADRFNRTRAWNIPLRTFIIKRLMPHHGKNFFFEPSIRVDYGCNITFGDNFYMNFDCKLLDCAPITIGDNVMFGPGVIAATPMHPIIGEERRIQQYPDGVHDIEYAKPITIGNDVWVASGAVICGGVTIGDNTVIAAGSVVTRDIPSGVVAGGVPCKVIRPITEDDRMHPWQTYCEDDTQKD